jgi:hypothetical protein
MIPRTVVIAEIEIFHRLVEELLRLAVSATQGENCAHPLNVDCRFAAEALFGIEQDIVGFGCQFQRHLRQMFPERPFRNWLSGVQLIEQRLRLFQIARIEALRKPAVNRSKQFASLLRLALVTPEAREAHCSA